MLRCSDLSSSIWKWSSTIKLLGHLDSQVMFVGIHGIDVSQVFAFSPSSGMSPAGQTHSPSGIPPCKCLLHSTMYNPPYSALYSYFGYYQQITFMHQESYQSNGPSLPRPVGSLHFRKTTGFTVHKRKAEDTEATSTHRYTKFQLDSHGALQLTTQVFTTPNITPKATTTQWGVMNNHEYLSYPVIPDCNDRLPPEVNLGILDIEPRRLMESISFNFVG